MKRIPDTSMYDVGHLCHNRRALVLSIAITASSLQACGGEDARTDVAETQQAVFSPTDVPPPVDQNPYVIAARALYLPEWAEEGSAIDEAQAINETANGPYGINVTGDPSGLNMMSALLDGRLVGLSADQSPAALRPLAEIGFTGVNGISNTALSALRFGGFGAGVLAFPGRPRPTGGLLVADKDLRGALGCPTCEPIRTVPLSGRFSAGNSDVQFDNEPAILPNTFDGSAWYHTNLSTLAPADNGALTFYGPPPRLPGGQRTSVQWNVASFGFYFTTGSRALFNFGGPDGVQIGFPR